MTVSLQSTATALHESNRALQRALDASRSQWNDATRQAFDQRHAEVVMASARKMANELESLTQQLSGALASLT